MSATKTKSIRFSRTALSRHHELRAAVRGALMQRRGTLNIGAGLVALGLVTQPAFAASFPAEFELSSLLPENAGDGRAGFVLNGIDVGDYSGASVSSAGDVNGDGIDDVLVAAFAAGPGGRTHAGLSYVVFGRSTTNFPARFELSSLLPANGGDGSAGFVLNGIDAFDESGRSVSPAGDVNGDGVHDLAIGAGNADPGGRPLAGQTYVVFGRDRAAFPAEMELSSLLSANGGDGSAGFVLNGIGEQDYAGASVSAAGDVNGDGIDDLLLGARDASPGGRASAGQSYVIFGRGQSAFPSEIELSSLLSANGGDGSAGFALNGIRVSDRSGRSTSAAGDVNGDGIDDLLVGAYGGDPGGRMYAGETYVVFGRDGRAFPAEFELSGLLPQNGGDGRAGFVLSGIDPFSFSGVSVSTAGDVNGDGVDDLLVGAPGAEPGGRSAGQSYVVFGRTRAAFPPRLELSSLMQENGGDGSAGFVLSGVAGNDFSGDPVSAAGDVNGDGIDDLLVSAYQASPGDRRYAGETYLVFGRLKAFPAEFELSRLLSANGGNGGEGVVVNGIDEDDFSGSSVAAAGDVNGDGVDDLLIGAIFAAPGGRDEAGESYVVFGRSADGLLCDGFAVTIAGTPGDDVIRGTSEPDVIHGLGGDDTIRGLGGNDIVCGGEGDNIIMGNAEDDRLFGGSDRNVLRGGPGNDQLFGGRGNDELFGDKGEDELRGGGGNDGNSGGPGDDRLFGGRDDDRLDGGAGFDDCDGGEGNGDTVTSCERSSNIP